MNKLPVNSSIIKSVGYDRADWELEIEFVKGSVYRYKRICPDEVICMLFSDSIGSYFMRFISKAYTYEKVR